MSNNFNFYSKLRISLVLFSVLICQAGVSAQTVQTPGEGSVERKAILDTLRKPVEKELKQKIKFVIETLRVQGSWSFVGGVPQSENGSWPDYRATKYQEAIDYEMFDNNIFALLKNTEGEWKVVTYSIGCTDVCYAGWWGDYKTPRGIFPYTDTVP
jgi:hypothetical protein